MPCRASPSWQVAASNGSTEVKSQGNAAMTIRTVIRAAEPMKSGRRRRSYQASVHRLATLSGLGAEALLPRLPCFAPRLTSGARVSLIANPWVEHGVEQVNDHVGQDVDQHQHGHDPDDHGLLPQVDRGEQLLA